MHCVYIHIEFKHPSTVALEGHSRNIFITRESSGTSWYGGGVSEVGMYIESIEVCTVQWEQAYSRAMLCYVPDAESASGT